MDESLKMFLNALHGLGVLLAVSPDPDRWTGICVDSHDRYWIVEGPVTSADALKRDGLTTTDHCYKPTYDEALAAFRDWWDVGFVGRPCGSACGNGVRPV